VLKATRAIKERIVKRLEGLSAKELQEEQSFIDYVNKGTQEALRARKADRTFVSLEELQQELPKNRAGLSLEA